MSLLFGSGRLSSTLSLASRTTPAIRFLPRIIAPSSSPRRPFGPLSPPCFLAAAARARASRPSVAPQTASTTTRPPRPRSQARDTAPHTGPPLFSGARRGGAPPPWLAARPLSFPPLPFCSLDSTRRGCCCCRRRGGRGAVAPRRPSSLPSHTPAAQRRERDRSVLCKRCYSFFCCRPHTTTSGLSSCSFVAPLRQRAATGKKTGKGGGARRMLFTED